MVYSKAQTSNEYLETLPEDRKNAMTIVRNTILENLPKGYEEVIQYGMISYVIPLETYPDTYNGKPLAIISLASQKNYMSVYLMCVYGNKDIRDWFIDAYRATGKKLDIGKSCIHFKKIEDLAVDLIGAAIKKVPVKRFIEMYEEAQSKCKTGLKKKMK